MSKKIEQIRIFISSPSDVSSERTDAEKVIGELNKTLCYSHGINLFPVTWENNTYPSAGDDPQNVINNQIGEYDVFVGIMANRFGTPTQRAGSGTEEEFDIAYNNRDKIHIMFFFKNSLGYSNDIDPEQLMKVREFKNKISAKVYYKEFSTDFESLFRTCLTNFIMEKYVRIQNDSSDDFYQKTLRLNLDFEQYLMSTDAFFTHPSGEDISLGDLYVPQNLKIISESNKNDKRTNIENLTSAIDTEGFLYHIIGEERSGKTALCKYVFQRYYYEHNLIPILLNGMDLSVNTRKDRILQIIINKAKEQYLGINKFPKEKKEENEDFVIIIDDFQTAAKGNDKYWKLLTANLESLFPNIIAVGDISISTHDLSANPPFENFDKYIIMEFGPVLRNQLVEKWNSYGLDTSVESKNEIRKKNDDANKQINSILGKNFIPAYPFYILGILQALEGLQNNSSINYSLHGFYYEHLINDSLIHSIKQQKDIGFYYNFLVFFCYFLFEQKVKEISIEQFEELYNQYCEKHDVDKTIFGIKNVKETLKETKLLTFNNNVRVGQNYIYYFFVAKYIANHIEDAEIKDIVQKICERIFKDEYANIIMFVTHLSKNNWIISILLQNASRIFPNAPICKLEQDIQPLNELMNDFTSRVIGAIDVDKERNSKLLLESELEERQKEFDNDDMNYSQITLDDDVYDIDLFAQINLAVKTIDILGQIAIKYWGELEAVTKYEIIETAYNIGLRTLGLYLTMMSNNKDDLAEYIANVIIDKYSNKSRADIILQRDDIQKKSLQFLADLSYLSSLAIITRISNSVGDERLNKTFDKILENNPYNSYKLINLSTDLNYPGLPINIIEKYSNDMKGNIMCCRLLRDLVINHMYKFDIEYKDKSRIQSLLNIKIQNQNLIQNSSQIKRR
ncbi:MAG: DUF4062 domain-containing protein [Bacteroidales bacterium]|nr:DUF4062 domain-containing protein [Bacteroidales bacterium]